MSDCSKQNFMMREQISIQLGQELFAAGTGEPGFICHGHADIAISYPETLAVISGVRTKPDGPLLGKWA